MGKDGNENMSSDKIKRLVMVILGLSVIALVIAVTIGVISIMMLIIAIIIGSLLFLHFRKSWSNEVCNYSSSDQSTSHSYRIFLVSGIAYFLLSSSALWAIISMHEKSIIYYVLIALSTFFLTIQIIIVDSKRKSTFIFIEIILLAVNIYASTQFIFPLGIGGSDAPTHFYSLVVPIIENGHIQEGGVDAFLYNKFPAHHILVASVSEALSTDPLQTYFNMGYLIMILPLVLVYSIGRSLYNNMAGLFAALLLSTASYYIYWTTHAAAFTYAIPLMAILILSILRIVDKRNPSFFVISIIIIITLVFTHHYTSFISVMIILGVTILCITQNRKDIIIRLRGFIIIFIAILITQWLYYSDFIRNAAILSEEWYDSLSSGSFIASPGAYDVISFEMIIINTIGDALLMIFGVLGFYYLCESRKYDPKLTMILNMTVVLILLTAMGVLTNLIYLLPNRIYIFLLVISVATLIGIAFYKITANRSCLFKSGWKDIVRKSRIMIVALIVATIVFMSITSSIAGFETSPFIGEQPYIKLFDTNHEEISVKWLRDVSVSHQILIIPRSLSAFSAHHLLETASLLNQTIKKLPLTSDGRLDKDILSGSSLIMYSDFDATIGFQMGLTGKGKLGTGILTKLDSSIYLELSQNNLIYDEGAVKIFINL